MLPTEAPPVFDELLPVGVPELLGDVVEPLVPFVVVGVVEPFTLGVGVVGVVVGVVTMAVRRSSYSPLAGLYSQFTFTVPFSCTLSYVGEVVFVTGSQM